MRDPLRIARLLGNLRGCSKIALDTNAIIYYVEQVDPYHELVQGIVEQMAQGVVVCVTSAIAEAEALVKPLREEDRSIKQEYESFFAESSNLLVMDVSRETGRHAAEIRARVGLRLPDAIVVATALESDCDALVGNDKGMLNRNLGLPYLHLNNYI